MATELDAIIRDWARRNGYSVGERGRLAKDIQEAYFRQHPNMRPINYPTETPSRYCRECWYDLPDHASYCSLATKKEVPPVTVVEYVEEIPTESAPEIVQEASEKGESTPNTAPALDAAASQFAAAIAALTANQSQPLDESRVREIATDVALEAIAEVATPRVYEIHIPEHDAKTVEGNVHARFEDVVKIVGAGLHAYLVGPPGTGKTTLCSQVADALSLDFAMISCDPTMPASKLFGFVDANGTERRTPFWDVYENGGLFLFDEIDNAHPGIIAGMNSALANGHCAFASRIVKRSPNFRCVAAANTFGTGATRQFVGRNQLDAATLDRFVTVVVDIDETLEEALTLGSLPENVVLAKEWLARVREWRGNVASKNLQVIISPRASIEGARLLGIGFTMAEVADMKVWKGIDAATRAKIESAF